MPLTEPYVRVTHTAPWIDRSDPSTAGLIPAEAELPRSHRRRSQSFSCSLPYAAEDSAARMRPEARSFPPPRAVGEHEAQLTVSRPSQSISPFAPRALPASSLIRRDPTSAWASSGRRCLLPVYRSRGPTQISPGKNTGCPAAPPPLPPRPRLDFGRRVRRHAHPAGPACSGVHFRSVLRFASGFFPTRPRGARVARLTTDMPRAVASGSRLLPTRPAKDFHLQSSAHARHTRGGCAPRKLLSRWTERLRRVVLDRAIGGSWRAGVSF